MTPDPTLFTSMEWVLLAMAGLVSLLMFALFHKSEPGSPFAESDMECPHETDANGENQEF